MAESADSARPPAMQASAFSWDAGVRLLHAVLALCVIFDWWHDDGGLVHRMVGYAAAAAVALRLLWAVVSRSEASLAQLWPSVPATWRYLRALLQGRAVRIEGRHDPLGLWMIWLLWLLVLALGLTGWLSRLDMFWGDDTLDAIHAWLANALLIAAAAHVWAVLVMSWLWKTNLPASMLWRRRRSDR